MYKKIKCALFLLLFWQSVCLTNVCFNNIVPINIYCLYHPLFLNVSQVTNLWLRFIFRRVEIIYILQQCIFIVTWTHTYSGITQYYIIARKNRDYLIQTSHSWFTHKIFYRFYLVILQYDSKIYKFSTLITNNHFNRWLLRS